MIEDLDRNTGDIIKTLEDDFQRCHSELLLAIDSGEKEKDGTVYADYEFEARQLIRVVFAFIESVTFAVKVVSADYCMQNGIPITPQERYLATDMEYKLNKKGKVEEEELKIPLIRNIRFAISLNRRVCGIEEEFDANTKWWNSLMCAIKVRNRITHPKLTGDLSVSGEDVVNALKAREGFADELLRFNRSDSD